MTTDARMAAVLTRIASVTSVLRTRNDDDTRFDRHGGRSEDLKRRVERVVIRLEDVASELEDALR